MQRPETHYAKSGDVHIAYQVFGTGPIDLVIVPGFISNLDVHWDDPGYAHLLWRLAGFARVIMFDKRGTGLSDPVSQLPNLETRMDDVRAVMDAAGSERAALLGGSEGGPLAMLFAATYPKRTRALVLYGSYAHFYSSVLPKERLETFIAKAEESWGTGASLRAFAPGMLEKPRFREWWARYERLGASPAAVVALFRMNAEIDVRAVLPTIGVPTLVIHRRDDVRVSFAGGRYLAEHIAGAKFVEIPGSDHLFWVGDTDRIADELEEFLTGMRPRSEHNRVLATIVALDISGAVRSADRLDRHDSRLHAAIEHFRGRAMATRPDGTLVSFDGPARAVRFAVAVRDSAADIGFAVRCGVHTGEIELHDGDAGGLAIHVAMRIAAQARPGEIFASSIVRDLVVGSELRFGEARTVPVEGLAEPVRIVAVKAEPPVVADADEASTADDSRLSPRERDILRLVARGMTNPEIAATTKLSEHTVKRHVANILTKLDLSTRAAAASYAARRNLV
jgi:pimeloyl-ACP methyl ester carboxylesterase/DNA-binding CsgD family transcriptional regulator